MSNGLGNLDARACGFPSLPNRFVSLVRDSPVLLTTGWLRYTHVPDTTPEHLGSQGHARSHLATNPKQCRDQPSDGHVGSRFAKKAGRNRVSLEQTLRPATAVLAGGSASAPWAIKRMVRGRRLGIARYVWGPQLLPGLHSTNNTCPRFPNDMYVHARTSSPRTDQLLNMRSGCHRCCVCRMLLYGVLCDSVHYINGVTFGTPCERTQRNPTPTNVQTENTRGAEEFRELCGLTQTAPCFRSLLFFTVWADLYD